MKQFNKDKLESLSRKLEEIVKNERYHFVHEEIALCLKMCEEIKKSEFEIVSSDVVSQTPSLSAGELVKLYIVDDDEDTQKLLRFTLKRKGFDVISEINPEEALKNLETINPDIILLDLMMPKVTGFEFLDRIKSYSNRNKYKIIVGSAKNFEQDKLNALKAGANEFISKPYNISELALRLQKLAGK